jgi:5-(carboxyamino)imidazole ribonucleotide synthase
MLMVEGVVVRPDPGALVHAQDKIIMRRRLHEIDVPCPRWKVVSKLQELETFGADVGWPVVLKTPRGGYDGKGVRRLVATDDAGDWLARGEPLLAEEAVDFRRELAVLVARSPHGQCAVYPVVETVQVDGVCNEVLAPADLSEDIAIAAQQMALRVASELDVTGMLAVEMFETDGAVLVNELAMRPHNSGHWTIDGSRTSQFEQHLRAVLDLPLGEPSMIAPFAAMANVLGGEEEDIYGGYLHCMARDAGLRIHMYGKAFRRGRKLGHVTATGDSATAVRERALHAARFLAGKDTT